MTPEQMISVTTILNTRDVLKIEFLDENDHQLVYPYPKGMIRLILSRPSGFVHVPHDGGQYWYHKCKSEDLYRGMIVGNDHRHREDGPAIIRSGRGRKNEWWLDGECLTREEHAQRVKK